MDNDFATKLQNVLSDPAALSKISAIASSLGVNQSSQTPSPAEETNSNSSNPLPNLPVALPQSDPRIALLSSIKPLLKEEKRGKVDSLLNAMAVASMIKTFRK